MGNHMPAGPSRIEYSTAFDHATSWLSEGSSPVLVVASASEFVDLALDRATEGVAFICEDAATRVYAEQRIRGLALPSRVEQEGLILPSTDWVTTSPARGRVLWASPQPASWRGTLAALSAPDSSVEALCILTGTAWGRLIRPLRGQSQTGEPANLARQLRGALAVHGWTITRTRAFGGVAAVGWAAVSRFTARLGRADLADRAEHAHRAASDTSLGASYELLLASRN
jgi:hypothetical protein